MKTLKKPAAHRGSTPQTDALQQLIEALMEGCSVKPMEVVTTPVNTHIATQVDDIGIDGFALDVLELTMPEWVPDDLQEEMRESLRGFSEWAALWIAESLTDCASGDALTTTGIKHIDDLLWTLYAKILKCARECGVNIVNHR